MKYLRKLSLMAFSVSFLGIGLASATTISDSESDDEEQPHIHIHLHITPSQDSNSNASLTVSSPFLSETAPAAHQTIPSVPTPLDEKKDFAQVISNNSSPSLSVGVPDNKKDTPPHIALNVVPQSKEQGTKPQQATVTSAKKEEAKKPEGLIFGRTQDRVARNISTAFTRGVEGFDNASKYGKLKSNSHLKKEEKKKEEKRLKKAKEEKIDLEKGWQLVSSSPNRDTKKPITLNPKQQGFELLGDNYTFYNNMPALGNFDKSTFLFSVELRSTNPGAFIQYWDGVKSVSSVPYNGKGEWETLHIEFIINAEEARFQRLYAAILGPVKNNDKPSTDVKNIRLLQKM